MIVWNWWVVIIAVGIAIIIALIVGLFTLREEGEGK